MQLTSKYIKYSSDHSFQFSRQIEWWCGFEAEDMRFLSHSYNYGQSEQTNKKTKVTFGQQQMHLEWKFEDMYVSLK